MPRRASFVRLLSGIIVAAALAFTTISAQIPGRNVNMVAGNTWPDGDPFLQRQNEPSIAASTRNPLHLIAGSNDYRTVDLPGLANDETGDAWLGLYKSFDGGQRWISTLLPGYPQDHSTVGLASPIHGYAAGADPVLRSGTNGLVYYAGLAFDRSNPATPDVPGKSAIFVARFIDNNNKEAGDTFEYLGTRALQTDPGGATGNFLDKPWMVVDIPRDNTRCTIVTPGEKGPITQNVPAGPVYVAYTLRSTDKQGPRYDVMFTRSVDCGNTWTTPVRLNAGSERTNQGATMAVDPRNGNVFIAWRQFDLDGKGDDAIMTAKFTLAGKKHDPPGFAKKFAKPKKGKGKGLDPQHFFKKGGVNRALEAAGLSPLDQATDVGTVRFRTNAYPSMVLDETGRIYLAWAERGYDPLNPDPETGSARVLVATSPDGKTWTNPQPVASENQKGHQLMPTITYAGGKLMLVYYDIRESRAQSFTKYVDDQSSFQRSTPDATGLRHTIDLRASMAAAGAVPQFAPSVRVSDYLEGPRYPGGPNVPWQVNPPNLPMFAKGTSPFIGDYVDVTAAPNFVLDATGKWVYNSTAGATPPIFHATWTDNRDVRLPLEDRNGDGNPWNDYTPPGFTAETPSIFDPTKTVPVCIPGNAGSRNQNIYTARITGGLLAGSPGNTKRLGYRVDDAGNPTTELLQRSFVVFVQNTSDEAKRFRLTITNQPAGGQASFEQFAALTSIEAELNSRSTASRTVYATSTDPHAMITVQVQELVPGANGTWTVKQGGLGSAIVLNPDIDNPDIDNPDIDNPDIDNPDIDNVEVYNPDIDNPDIDNPDIDNPDIDNPDIDNPDIDNVRVMNPDIDNPDIDNPDIDNPDIDNPDIDNPDIDNPDIDNASLMTDVSWSITNTGNTTAAYNVNLFFAQTTFKPEISTQLILYRTYKTPVVQNCVLKTETRNVLVANVPNPQLVKSSTGTVSNPNDPAATNATIYLAPGESAKITLRVFDPNPDPAQVVTVTNDDGSTAKISTMFVPNEDVTPVVQQQSVDTEDVDDGVTEPPVVVQFPAPQTTVDAASTAANTPVKLNVLANDSTAFGSTKIISFHPAGMAAHSGATAGDIAYQPSTGYLYTARGAVDPASNTLVGRFALPPTGFAAVSQKADAVHGVLYGRAGDANASLTALDTRPGSANFHMWLPMPALSDAVLAFALDPSHNKLYAVHGPQTPSAVTPTTLTEIDISEDDDEFTHTIGRSISLPPGVRAQQVAVNRRTQKVYIAATGTTSVPGSVFVVDMTVPAPVATRIPNTTAGSWGVVVNEASNMVFASASVGNGAVVLAIDGGTNAVAVIPVGAPMRFGSNDERLAVHEASGKVYFRLENIVAIIDGQRGSPTRNSLLATVGVGRENGQTDIAVDEERGVVVTVGSFDFQVDLIDVATNALRGSHTLSTFGQDVAIDPINHRAYLGVFTYVQQLDLPPAPAPTVLGTKIPVFIESGSILLDPTRNKGYMGLFTTGANIEKLSGAGFEGALSGINTEGRYLYSAWHRNSDRGFMLNQANDTGTSANAGTVLGIDGATGAALGYVDVLPMPFGIGIDQDGDKVYVGSLQAPNAHGGVSILDVSGPGEPPVTFATFTATAPSTNPVVVPAYPAFPLNNSSALLAFGRHLVVNTNPYAGNARKMYVMQIGGSATSVAVYDPATNTLKPLDGIAGSPIFDAQGGANWGRAAVITINQAANRIYIGYLDSANVGRIVELDGTNDSFVRSWVGGSHSNRHTASFITVNEALQRIYVTDYVNSTVTMLDAATLTPIGAPRALPQGPSATAFNAAANRLYVSSIDSKTITALDGSTLQPISSVRLPLTAYFLWVDEVESRIYASGGDSADESGAMVVTDVLGQLGTNVSVTSVGSAQHGIAVLDPMDFSVTYTPNPGYSGPDSFSYNISAPTGTAVGTVNINVVPSAPSAIAFGEAYSVTQGQPLSVPVAGVLANDSGRNQLSAVLDQTTPNGVLNLASDGSFTYQPNANFTGVDQFTYHAVDDSLGASNTVTVTISVTSPASLVVTTTANSGAGSLRQAINSANSEPGSVITFNIAGAGPHTITPTEALPAILSPMTIDGYSPTQAGASMNTGTSPTGGTDAVIKVRISGSAIAAANTHGLNITGGGSTIKGLAIGNFTGSGISIDVAGGNVIAGNFIGTLDGSTAAPNGGAGISVMTGGNVIGGNTAGARNVISGNTGRTGVSLFPRTSGTTLLYGPSGTVVKGNLIGLNAAGTAALPNQTGIGLNASGIVIGGDLADERNVISGNSGTGIVTNATTVDPDGSGGPAPLTLVATPDHTTIRGNYIGVNALGNGAVANGNGGVFLNGELSEVRNNVISGNTGTGLTVNTQVDTNTSSSTFSTVWTRASNTVITGNTIGLNAAGNAAIANSSNGLQISAPGVTVGGPLATDRNIVSGNSQAGISLNNLTVTPTGGVPTLTSAGDGAIIRNNYVGLDRLGNSRFGNGGNAITIAVANAIIGGPNPGDGNYVALGNTGSANGINLTRGLASGTQVNAGGNTLVQGNVVGLFVNGSRTNGGANFTIAVNVQTAGNQVLDNVIAGNGAIGTTSVTGFSIFSTFANNNVVKRNFIGTNSGGADLRNTNHGIFLQDGANNTIGGTAAEGNTVAFNTQTGIAVTGATATGNALLGNRVYSNGQLGINLGSDFLTGNDAGDGDTGSNNLQNYPVLTGFSQAAVTSVTINTTSFTNVPGGYTLQFFANASCDASGNGEGQRLVASRTGIGVGGAITIPLDELVPDGEFVTATATDPNNNTSEFSACLQIGNPSVVVNTNDSGVGSLREAINHSNNTAGTQTITFNIPGVTPASWAVISLQSALPVITGPVTINGFSQPGQDGTPVIELSTAVNIPNGLETAPDVTGVTIQGLMITRFTNAGIMLMQNDSAAVGNLVSQNIVGTDRNGAIGKGNATGIVVRSDHSNIGTNKIAGNSGTGLRLENDADNVTVVSNTIGMINGVAVPNGGSGVTMYHSLNNNTFNGNVISGNLGWGVDIQDSVPGQVTGTQFYGNKIGVDDNGGTFGNALGGIRLENAPSTLVGVPGQARNVIGGNGGAGIRVLATTAGTVPNIRNNYIGLDHTGAVARPNNNKGIYLDGPAFIGGSAVNEGNYISGQSDPIAGAGILVGVNAGGTIIRGNTIGLNAAGNVTANGYAGITVAASAAVTIGGNSGAGEGNVISGNGVYGISVIRVVGADPLPNGTIIRGNRIGTDVGGTLGRSNGTAGINAAGTNIQIGGTGAGEGNIIAFNGTTVQRGGIVVDTVASGVRIERNSIYGNNGLGIDLLPVGNTANDAGDGDAGANNLQNYALVTDAAEGNPTQVSFSTVGFASGSYALNFYSSSACGNNGQTWQGTTNANDGVTGTFNLLSNVPTGHFITATATDASGNTSEFSPCTAVVGSTVVTNTSSSGPGSLRNAIDAANATPGPDTITFAINGATPGQPAVIALASTLPILTSNNTVIDGTTMPGYAGVPLVVIDGQNTASYGLFVSSASVTITGLSIVRFPTDGIWINSNNTTLTANYIGVLPNGTAAGNQLDGVRVNAGPNNIGTSLALKNVISGNGRYGVFVNQSAGNNAIRGNYIGVDPSGTVAMGNGAGGIEIGDSQPVQIGGTGTSPNVISGNGGNGIHLRACTGGPCSGHIIHENRIGTNAAGTATVPNVLNGIQLADQSNTDIKKNLISGNGANGILVGNSPSTMIGGWNAGNTITNNAGAGVWVQGNQSGVRIETNIIDGNAGLGIDGGAVGITANDYPDTNGIPNYPVISNANNTLGNTHVTLDTTVMTAGTYLVEFFKSQSCDASGYGEGTTSVMRFGITAQTGVVNLDLNQVVTPGWFVTALATADATGATSEFSQCAPVAQSPVISSVEPATSFGAGQMITLIGTNLEAVASNVIIRSGGIDYPASYLFHAALDGTKLIARLSGAAPLGPAQLIAKKAGIESAPVNAIIQAQAAAPIFKTVRNGNCSGYGGPGDTPTTWSGEQLLLVASGIDTTGTRVFFTPSGGGASAEATVLATCLAEGHQAVHVQVPAVAVGTYDITMRTSAGGTESVNSNTKTLNVETFSVNGMSGGSANSNCGTCTPPAPGPFGPQLFGIIPAGQTIGISASGQVNNGGTLVGPQGSGPCSECLDPALPRTALIGRWSGGNWFVIGAGGLFTNPGGSDYLQLAINDRDYTDNGGQFSIVVSPQ